MVGDGSYSVGVSMGLALYPEDARSAQGLIIAADRALYAVKQGEKGTIQFA